MGIANQLIALKNKTENPFTRRRVGTASNWFLLQDNPVATSHLKATHYGKKQAKFFTFAPDEIKGIPDFSQLITDDNYINRNKVTSKNSDKMINNLFTQVYFQILFSDQNQGYPKNKRIQIAVNNTHNNIVELVNLIEKISGKPELSASKLIRGIKPFLITPKAQLLLHLRSRTVSLRCSHV